MARQRCVVIGGMGSVGRLFAEALRDAGAAVVSVDVRAGVGCDITDPGADLRAELARADTLVLAVPEPVALRALRPVAGALAPRALIVDTLSVKSRFCTALGAWAPRHEAVSLNPMFAPQLGIDGGAIAAVIVHDGPRGRHLLALLATLGGRIVELSAPEHDRLAGSAQALVHAAVLSFGLAISNLGADPELLARLAPPPCVTLLALLARIAAGAPDTYWDVQSANDHADVARAAMADALCELNQLVDRGDRLDFAVLLLRLAESLGTALPALGDTCQSLFQCIRKASHDPLSRSHRAVPGAALPPR
jgi:prephenate dehydrogenase